MKKKWLTDSQYEVCMKALGYTYDEELGQFFKNDMCFLGNIDDEIDTVEDLIQINGKGYPTYMATVINHFVYIGAELAIGEGAIDGYGIKSKKGLYCTNYRELFSDKGKVKSKKIED